ncbi:MAG: GAF domain-containing protein [Gaiellaceae bacterium]
MAEQAVGAPVEEDFVRLEALVEAAGRLLETLDLDTLLPRVLDLARATLDADAFSLWARSPTTDLWSLRASDGLSQAYVDASARLVRGNENSVALDGPIVVGDVAKTTWLLPAHREAHAAEGTQSFLAVPLHHRDDVIGTLVFYYRSPRVFTDAELRSVGAIGSLAAAALGTAETYSQQAQLAEDRRLIAEASEQLATSLDYETTLKNVAWLVVPTFADWCAIDMVDDDGAIQRLTVAHVDPEKVRLADELAHELPPDRDAPQGVGYVIRTREPELVPEVTDAMLVEALADRPHALEVIRELGLLSAITVPLVARDRALGAITFVTAESGRRYNDADLAHALDLARRAAVAVDNARLFGEAIQNERQLRFLADAGAALNESLDYEATFQKLARLVVPEVADWCIVDVIEGPDVRRVAVAAAASDQQTLLDELKLRYPLDPESTQPAAQALRAGKTVVLEDLDSAGLSETVIDDVHYRIMSALAPRSAVAIPLVARGETLGAITFAWSRSKRRYRERDLPLLEDLAARASLAIDNARLFERELSAGERLSFLAEAGSTLASSLDYETTLANVAELVVPRLADWCAVDVLEEDGHTVRRLTLVHKDPAKLGAASRSRDLLAPTVDEAEGSGRVLRTGEPVLYEAISEEFLESSAPSEEHAQVLKELGLYSAMVVPMRVGGRVLGALTFASDDPRRRYSQQELEFAEQVGRRAATAVDNALLYRGSEQRAQATLALMFVGDGVLLVDEDGVVRIWNTAAAVITGIAAADVVGRRAEEAITAWPTILSHVPLASGPGRPRAETIPVELEGAERWLSISGVAFEGGTVYAFRDLTEERRVERLKSEFVSTISHELRTPLAAIYGAALTLRREEPSLEAQREGLLDVIAGESERLARIVNDILWASRLESGTLHVAVESCDARNLASLVVDATRAHLPANIELEYDADTDAPPVAADPDKLRQVLTNLVDNAIKYSPDGGTVRVDVKRLGSSVLFSIRDEGLGIPLSEQSRIFEKFYRLDPELTRGVGGTGLGLYISRELVRHMDGRLTVTSSAGKGSTFLVELPIAP